MPADAVTLTIDERPARGGEDPLWTQLQAAVGQPLTISVAHVGRLDTRRLSMLLSAQRQWQADGMAFAVTDATPRLREGLVRMGLGATHFDQEGEG